MEIILTGFAFIFGTIIGSFLNVVIFRYGTGKSLGGRSRCLSCGKQLTPFELLPVWSFIIQGGKCAGCSSKYSWQYPAVEFAAGLIFMLLFNEFFSELIFTQSAIITFCLAAIFWSLYIVIFVYDLRHKIIPDGVVYAASFVAFLTHFATGRPEALMSSVLTGASLFVFFASLWLVSRGKWMGFGDAKLGLSIGLLLGLGGISAVMFGFWIGASFSMAVILLQRIHIDRVKSALNSSYKRLTIKSEVPFAPFLIIGTALVYFFGIQINFF